MGKMGREGRQREATLFIDIWSLAMKPILKGAVVPFCLLPLNSLVKHL